MAHTPLRPTESQGGEEHCQCRVPEHGPQIDQGPGQLSSLHPPLKGFESVERHLELLAAICFYGGMPHVNVVSLLQEKMLERHCRYASTCNALYVTLLARMLIRLVTSGFTSLNVLTITEELIQNEFVLT